MSDEMSGAKITKFSLSVSSFRIVVVNGHWWQRSGLHGSVLLLCLLPTSCILYCPKRYLLIAKNSDLNNKNTSLLSD